MARAVMLGIVLATSLGTPAMAEVSNEDLLRRIEALQRRVDELEGRKATKATAGRTQRAPASGSVASVPPAATPPAAATAATAPPAAKLASKVSGVRDEEQMVAKPGGPLAITADQTETSVLAPGHIPGLLPPEPMGTQFEDALRSDLPGLSIRIPGTDSEVRLYGFAKLTGYRDFDARNQTDGPPPSAIPLRNSAAARQGGDFGMTARLSRFGVDTRTQTGWGTLETRLEGDFAGGSATSANAGFRLRQAWAELGTERFRILAGQANSLWNEGLFETLIDATNLNQSFTRQAQLRATGRLAPGLVGQVSLEAPDTQFTSNAGVFNTDASFNGGASPSFNSVPDLLGRLTYRHDGLELVSRGLLRQLSLKTSGTAFAASGRNDDTLGWGFAGHARFPMRWLSAAFGPDELLGMAYYGDGIGRYFGGNASGLDALSSAGLPGTSRVALDAVSTYGAVAAYRRFWTTQLRSNVSYAYAHQDFPSYARAFTAGTPSATSLNRDMQQVFLNLIYSPFASVRDNVFGAGWLDVGAEYLYTRRDVLGGAQATRHGRRRTRHRQPRHGRRHCAVLILSGATAIPTAD